MAVYPCSKAKLQQLGESGGPVVLELTQDFARSSVGGIVSWWPQKRAQRHTEAYVAGRSRKNLEKY